MFIDMVVMERICDGKRIAIKKPKHLTCQVNFLYRGRYWKIIRYSLVKC